MYWRYMETKGDSRLQRRKIEDDTTAGRKSKHQN